MAKVEITQTFYAPNRAAWRQWLADHHATATEIWLVTYGRATGNPSVPYLGAVEEALCFGWIDGIAKKIDLVTLRKCANSRLSFRVDLPILYSKRNKTSSSEQWYSSKQAKH